MFCSSCGNKLVDGVAFCSACGAKVGDTATSASPTSPREGTPANELKELVESLTTNQCSIEQNEDEIYVIRWKDPVHSKDVTLDDVTDFGGVALVEELSVTATPMIVANIYDAVSAAASIMSDLPYKFYVLGMDNFDVLLIMHGDEGDYPAYGIKTESCVSNDFSHSVNRVFVQRYDSFKLRDESGASFSIKTTPASSSAEDGRVAQWDRAVEENKSDKYGLWAAAVKILIDTALSLKMFNADVRRSANYLTGDLSAQ